MQQFQSTKVNIMKKIIFSSFIPFYFLVIVMLQSSMIIASNAPKNNTTKNSVGVPAPKKISQSNADSSTLDNSITSNSNDDIEKISAILFTPTLSSTSINEKFIDKIYGSSGVNIPADQVTHIKQTYSYLEFLTKIDLIATDPSLIKDKTYFLKIAASTKDSAAASKEMIESKEWMNIIITSKDIEQSTAWQLYLKSKIVDYYENQQDFLETISMVHNQMFPYLPNIELNFYNNDFIKLRNFAELLRATKIIQDRAFHENRLLCIDWQDKDPDDLYKAVEEFKSTQFYTYTHDKNKSTATKMNALSHPLQEHVTAYFMLTTIDQSLEKKFDTKNLFSFLKKASSATIAPHFFSYTLADFVCLDMILTLQKKLSAKPSTVTGLQQKTFNIADLVDLTKAQSSPSTQQIPATKSTITSTKNSASSVVAMPQEPSDTKNKSTTDSSVTEMPAEPQDVVIQATSSNKNINNTFKKLGKSLGSGIEHDAVATGHALGVNKMINTSDTMLTDDGKAIGQGLAGSGAQAYGAMTGNKSAENWGKRENKSASKDVAGAVKSLNKLDSEIARSDLAKMTVNGTKAVVLGTAGFGATMIGDIVYAQTGNASIKDWGAKQSAASIKDLEAAGQEMDTAIKGCITAIEDSYIAMSALVLGDFIGLITGDQKMGQGLTLAMNQVGDSVMAIQGACMTSMVNLTVDATVQTYRVSESAVEILEDATLVVYGGLTGQKGATNRAAAMSTATAKGLIKNVTLAATQTMSCIMKSGMAIMMSIMQCMAAVENTMTTIIFDIVDELTFIAYGLAELMGAPVNAAQERDKIDTKMEAHRSTINMVMSVVLAIVFTAATAGAGAPEAAAMITTAEAGGEVAGEVAAETAEQQAARIAAEQAAAAATKKAAEVAAATAAAETTAEGTTEATTEATAETTGEEATTEATAETGSKTAATKATAEATTASKALAFTMANAGDILAQTMNILFGAFSIISGKNQDDAAIKLLGQEKESITNLWQFIENNKVVMTQSQNAFIDELHKKHQVAIENQSFGLQYYTNYLHSSVNNVQNQIAHALAQQYISLLTPDANGARIADIGSTWGITTPFVYLYPSQGFLTTTLGRPDFPYAQEVAQAPLVAQPDATKNALDQTKSEPLKLWFNQRAITTINQPASTPLDIEIQFRIIYNLTTDFHVGLYLGGNYYDYSSPDYLQKIQETDTIDLDDAHLAKMFVLMREGDATTPSIGVYENEGKEWITKKPLNATLFNNAAIYCMSAKLDKNKLTVAFWRQDKPTAKFSSTVTVTPCDQRTFGLIFSGAAIEWNVVKPAMPVTANNQVRTALNNPPEATREATARAAWAALKNPTFGSIKLSSLGKKYLIQGQYLYTTSDTKLVDKKGLPVVDVVAFATFTSGKLSNVGASPNPADVSNKPNAIISMINGNVYDATGANVSYQQDSWKSFVTKNGPFDVTLTKSITSKQNVCPQKPIVVDTPTISLDDISIAATPAVGGFQFGLSSTAPSDIKTTAQSFDKRQAQAAASATVQIGGLTSVGSGGFSL